MGFEPTIPASEGAKTVHALDSAGTVIGAESHTKIYNYRELRLQGVFLCLVTH
jgi:hypothetical protein